MKKINVTLLLVLYYFLFPLNAYSQTFEEWKINFSNYAIKQGVSEKTLSLIIKDLDFCLK